MVADIKITGAVNGTAHVDKDDGKGEVRLVLNRAPDDRWLKAMDASAQSPTLQVRFLTSGGGAFVVLRSTPDQLASDVEILKSRIALINDELNRAIQAESDETTARHKRMAATESGLIEALRKLVL